jgi:hypothetical protein
VVVRRLKNSLLSCDTPGLALHVAGSSQTAER